MKPIHKYCPFADEETICPGTCEQIHEDGWVQTCPYLITAKLVKQVQEGELDEEI